MENKYIMENITLNQLVFRIIGLYRAASKNTDDIPSERMIKDWIHSTRAMLLKQRLDKPFAYIDDQLVQTFRDKVNDWTSPFYKLVPVALEEVDSSQFEVVKSGVTMLRTKSIIPPTINRRGMVGTFTRVGPVDRLDRKYKVVSHETALVSGNGKFNKNDIYVFPLEGRLYLKSKVTIPYVMLDIKGVFQNPSQVPGFSDEGHYPINRELVDIMEQMIAQSKFPTTLVGYKDTIANEADDLVQTTQKQQR